MRDPNTDAAEKKRKKKHSRSSERTRQRTSSSRQASSLSIDSETPQLRKRRRRRTTEKEHSSKQSRRTRREQTDTAKRKRERRAERHSTRPVERSTRNRQIRQRQKERPNKIATYNLRKEREIRKLKLECVSHEAGIPLQFIEALETGHNLSRLPSTLLSSYRRKYLKYLHLPVDAELHFVDYTHAENFGGPAPKRDSRRRQRRGSSLRTNSPRPSRGYEPTQLTTTDELNPPPLWDIVKSISVILVIVFTLTKVISYFNTAEVSDTERPENSSAQFAAVTPAAVEVKTKTDAIESKSTEPEAAAAATQITEKTIPKTTEDNDAAATPAVSSLKLSIIDRTRVNLSCDEEVLWDGVAKAGEKIPRCRFSQAAKLWVYDLSRVRMYFNGRAMTPMGPQNKGRSFSFKRN